MSTRYLLDTNTVSEAIRARNRVLKRRLDAVPIQHLGVSAVSEAELRFGMARLPFASRLNLLIDEFLFHLTVLPWDSPCAVCYGELRANLEREGKPMENLDLMIAAHAIALQLTLVTGDKAFSRIKGLNVVDWTK
jgi:tRNA(fMet)-specific endonuclease VapC